jgi:hypothetical protein
LANVAGERKQTTAIFAFWTTYRGPGGSAVERNANAIERTTEIARKVGSTLREFGLSTANRISAYCKVWR